jgi:hypothetical protein
MSESATSLAQPHGTAALRPLLEPRREIRVTLHLPLRPFPQAAQNVVRARHAVETATKRLDAWPRAALVRDRLEALLGTVEASVSRAPASGSLVVMLDADRVRMVAMAHALAPAVSVGECFLLRPMLRALASDIRYRALGASMHQLALFDGDSRGLERVSCGSRPIRPEHSLGSDPARFHEMLGRAITHAFWRDTTPLVLVTDIRHQAGLRAACRAPGLLETGVAASPDHMTAAEIHARTWPLVQAELRRRAHEARAHYELARNAGKAVSFLDDVASAAIAGRVRRLWVDADLSLPGYVHFPSGRVLASESDAEVLDSLAELVIERGGEVFVVDPDDVPSVSGVAAELH